MVEVRSLHSGGLVCIAETRSVQQICEARVCIAEAHGVRGFPPLGLFSTFVFFSPYTSPTFKMRGLFKIRSIKPICFLLTLYLLPPPFKKLSLFTQFYIILLCYREVRSGIALSCIYKLQGVSIKELSNDFQICFNLYATFIMKQISLFVIINFKHFFFKLTGVFYNQSKFQFIKVSAVSIQIKQ